MILDTPFGTFSIRYVNYVEYINILHTSPYHKEMIDEYGLKCLGTVCGERVYEKM